MSGAELLTELSPAAANDNVEAVPAPNRREVRERLRRALPEVKNSRPNTPPRQPKPSGASAYARGCFPTYFASLDFRRRTGTKMVRV